MKAWTFLCLSVLSASVAALGCGGSSGGGVATDAATEAGAPGNGQGCTSVVQGSCVGANHINCTNFSGYDATSVAQFMKSCGTAAHGTWSTGPCDKTGTVGGCETNANGACALQWSFAPVTTADLQSGCVGSSMTFVAP
jgi:hypothetical protein